MAYLRGTEASRPIVKCIMLCTMTPERKASGKSRPRRSRWVLVLLLPYLGLCFPIVYARSTPALWGFPFFYWYQFVWVILTSALLAIVYRKLKT
jgi:Protein of unknown function (DUF3311)